MVNKESYLDVKTGVNNPSFNLWMNKNALTSGGVLTAYNPLASQISENLNRDKTEQLKSRLISDGFQFYPSINLDASNRWPDEPGFFIINLSSEQLLKLALKFNQSAVIFAKKNHNHDFIAQLLWVQN